MCGPNPCSNPSCTWSPQFLRECEARRVMKLPIDQRREFYAAVKRSRGEKAMNELKVAVSNAWKTQQSLL